MPEPMNDNARIVREAQGIGGHNYDPRVEAARWALTALESELATTKAREAGLTKAPAEVQADLARAREEERERCLEAAWKWWNGRSPERPCGRGSLESALAPEQKG